MLTRANSRHSRASDLPKWVTAAWKVKRRGGGQTHAQLHNRFGRAHLGQVVDLQSNGGEGGP